jgi:colanic acid/amylovoran biosynthesis glycosyltransferase
MDVSLQESEAVSEKVTSDSAEVRPHRLAYVVSLFPCWSETFIAEEVQQLLDLGFDISIFSLRQACEPDVHPLSLALLPRTKYAGSLMAILRAQSYFLGKEPLVYLAHFFRLLFGERFAMVQRLKTMATFFIAAYFAQLTERSKAERVHAHWATFGATAAWTISELTGLPFTFTTHAHDLFLPDDLLPNKIRAAESVVTISEFNRKLLDEKYQASEKVHVVHCGVDTRKFAPVKRHAWEAQKLLAVGRLVPIKGFPTLIKACGILKAQGHKFSCEIVGDGPLAEELRREIQVADVADCVKLSGFAPQEEVRRMLAQATVFVMPSEETKSNDRDGIPVALMEAMSMGIPVVSTFVSGIPELVEDGVSGLLVQPGNPIELAAAVRSLLENRDKCSELAAQGKSKVLEEFDVSRNARKLGALFSGQA